MDLTASPADGYIYIKIPKTIGTSPPDRNFFLTGRGFFAGAGLRAGGREMRTIEVGKLRRFP